MRLTIESTELHTAIDGQLMRIWKGTTERGIECMVLVAGIGVQPGEDDEFKEALIEMQAADSDTDQEPPRPPTMPEFGFLMQGRN